MSRQASLVDSRTSAALARQQEAVVRRAEAEQVDRRFARRERQSGIFVAEQHHAVLGYLVHEGVALRADCRVDGRTLDSAERFARDILDIIDDYVCGDERKQQHERDYRKYYVFGFDLYHIFSYYAVKGVQSTNLTSSRSTLAEAALPK